MERLIAQLHNPVLPPELGGGTGAGADYNQGGTALGKLVGGVLGMVFIIAFILAFVYLVVGAVRWITSGGDKAAMEGARNAIVHAIMGIIIVGAAWAVMSLVGQFLGLNIEALPIPVVPSL
jgi:hypothetical protein